MHGTEVLKLPHDNSFSDFVWTRYPCQALLSAMNATWLLNVDNRKVEDIRI